QQPDYVSTSPPDAATYQQPDGGSFTPSYPNSSPNQASPGYPVAPYASAPQRDNTGKILGRIGCGALLLIVLALALCGGLSYGLYTMVSKSVSDSARSTPTSSSDASNTSGSNANSSGTNSTYGATPAAASAKTVPLNLNVKYSAVTYTLVDVKQAANFDGDRENSSPGVVRVDFKEVNSTSHSIIFGYTDAVHLILPDGNSVPAQSYKNLSPPANGASQDNWLDFPAPLSTPIDKLVLRFGTAQQAQMDVPLVTGADLAKYQDVTVKPNTATNYGGLKWTLTSATLGWSGYDKQAENGKRYVTINVSIDNPTTAYKSAYWGDYLRLKTGNGITAPDVDSTIPTGFDASSTGATGNAIFLVPQGSKTFTMVLLADKIESGAPQATIDFHIP
ncbi:MAG: hypothetical protein H0U76_03420, partial [Ktedonobacteraceae bacterium]|nr:hypothetical protein [Ktedonobacteraceae bacterium]